MSRVLALQIVFAMGIINLLMVLALFFSCRCLGAKMPFSSWIRRKAFGRFYRLHCYFWIVLGLSIGTHLVVAILALGIPFGS